MSSPQQPLVPPASPAPAHLVAEKLVGATPRAITNATLLSAVFVLVIAVQLIGSEEHRIYNALSTPRIIYPPFVGAFQNRTETGVILTTLAKGKDYLVVEGGNRVGKSTAVASAISVISSSRAVVRTDARASDSLDSFLRRLLGLSDSGVWNHLISKLSFGGRCADIATALKHRKRTNPQPVLVVEAAEVLPVDVLKDLFRLAKELADAQLGLFVFVLSPSDKLQTISSFSALSRATIISIEDLSKGDTLAYLSTALNCSPVQAETAYELLGGHLPNVVSNSHLEAYCSGQITKEDFFSRMRDKVWVDATEVDDMLHCEELACSCPGLCSIIHRRLSNETYIKARDTLVRQSLARASLARKRLVVDSPLIVKFIDEQCHCF